MTFIIAEAGINHNGSMAEAKRLIDAAKNAEADAVKFQLFKDRPMIEHLRLDEDEIQDLYAWAEFRGIEFMCTPFYVKAVKFLDPMVRRHKVASGWTKDTSIFDAAVATGKPVIASLGMMTLLERERLKPIRNVAFLHCISIYPCPDNEVHLSHAKIWDGYSDHTVGTLACIAAVAMGARIIEKHLTLDKRAEGPDHCCSAEPAEFAKMVKQIRRLEKML